MRRIVIGLGLALALAASRGHARAEVVEVPPPPPAPPHDFWRELTEPHADEVNAITTEVQIKIIAPLDSAFVTELELTADQRTRVLQAALGKLQYARKLAPDNPLVLAQLGRVADELGHTRQATEALQTCLDLVGPDKAGPEVTGLLGRIHLRLGDLDAAIRYLRLAQGPAASPASGEVLIDLSTALALRGEMSDAIDVLASAIPPSIDYNAEQWGVAFGLAVQYDRDDQRGAAFAVLDKLQNILQDQSYASQMQSWLASVRFTPAEDQHYYAGLFYESLDNYAEARAEWALYAASGGAFRARALEHVAALDAQRRLHPVKPELPVPPPRRMIRIHRMPRSP